MGLIDKDKYEKFCADTFVPIYSKPWWMDAICGKDNWDVWLYEEGGTVAAAMPYYLEERAAGLYITKPPLTQNNGIIFKYPEGSQPISRAKFEERVVDAADSFICNLGLAVYEQQYQYSFTNWLPFYWRGYDAAPRYTFVIENTKDIDAMWKGLSSSYRKNVKKGLRSGEIKDGLDPMRFYEEHAKVFLRQNLHAPFNTELWIRLYQAAKSHDACKILFSDVEGSVASLLFLVWDEKSVYHLLGGTMPGFNRLETYNSLTWTGMQFAHELGLKYDFEGSMIERIAKSFREFGGNPKQYFRIRKVFDSEVARLEAQQKIERTDR